MLLILILMIILPLGVKFKEDIPEIYKNSINYLLEKNIIKGYPDGTFKVDWAITEGEFLTLIVRCNLKFGKENVKKNFLDKISTFFINLFNMLKKKKESKFLEFEDKWFHPYLIEYYNITKIDEKEIDPYFFLSIYDAFYFELKASPFKNEIESINLPLDNYEKAIVLATSVSHNLFPEKVSFKERLSRGDAFLLIEKYLRSKEDVTNY